METTRWLIAHFSPTGTTVKIARTIAQGSGCPTREVDLTASTYQRVLEQNEILLAAVPVYGGRVPALALERLAILKGNGQKAVAVTVYGNRAYDDALLELKDSLEGNGFQVVAAAAFVAEHSIAREIAAGRPDSADLEKAAAFGASVMDKLSQGEAVPLQVPGNPGYKGKQSGGGTSPHPQANDSCDRCGICAGLCPVEAIPKEEPGTTDNSRCINCMRCISVCPQKARALPALMLTAVTEMLKTAASEPKQPELFL